MFGSINGIHAEVRPDSASVRPEIFSYQEMVYCSGSTLGIVPLDNSPFVLGSAEGLWSKLSGKAHD